jgi:hypothetical protein
VCRKIVMWFGCVFNLSSFMEIKTDTLAPKSIMLTLDTCAHILC